MIGDQVVPAVGVMRARVSEVFRQAAQSRIIISAHRINRGSIPDLSPPGTESDFYFVQADEPETAVPRIIELVKTRIPRRFGLDPIRDVQVLSPMNRGGVGARSLNIELQAVLNPAGDRKVERIGWTGIQRNQYRRNICLRINGSANGSGYWRAMVINPRLSDRGLARRRQKF